MNVRVKPKAFLGGQEGGGRRGISAIMSLHTESTKAAESH